MNIHKSVYYAVFNELKMFCLPQILLNIFLTYSQYIANDVSFFNDIPLERSSTS